MTEEIGWVIVRYTSIIRAITYWTGKSFNVNPLDAVRFARKSDAETVRDTHCKSSDSVEEHMWCPAEEPNE